MNIFAEVTIDETGIIKQIDAVKEAADRFEDEALKLRGMLAQAKATAKVKKKRQRSNELLCTIQDFFAAIKAARTINSPVGELRISEIPQSLHRNDLHPAKNE